LSLRKRLQSNGELVNSPIDGDRAAMLLGHNVVAD